MSKDGIKALTVTYREGETIVAAGERGGCMFVVQSGAVRLSRPSESDGSPVELAILEKGDFFGESAILEGQPYRFFAEATSESEVVEISAATLQQMLKANPEVAVRLLRKLSSRLDRLEARVAEKVPVADAVEVVEAVEVAAPPIARSVESSDEEPAASLAGDGAAPAPEAETAHEPAGEVAVATEVAPEENVDVEVDVDVEDLVEGRDAPILEEAAEHEVEEAAVEASAEDAADEVAEPTPDAKVDVDEPAPQVAASGPPTGPRLVSEDGETCFALDGDEVLIGRYDPVTEIQPEIDLSTLDDKRSVSRRHARLTKRRGTWYLSEEVGALNGTFVNGVKLLAGRGAPISDGDTLSLGMVRVVYHAE